MRLGNTPTKEKPELTDYLRHRVIIPVYIPTLEGYYKDALAILKLCLESLHSKEDMERRRDEVRLRR